MLKILRVPLALCLVLLAVDPARAQAPSGVNYQGRLLQGTNLYNGEVDLVLRLYTAATGGTLLYADSNRVTVVDGLYSTTLGDGTTYGNLNNALSHTGVYLQVIVNATPLTPREPVASVAHALMAWSLNGNEGALAGTNFLGTLNNVPVEIRVNNRQALLATTGGVAVAGTDARQQLSVGHYLDLYSGSAKSPQQASVRASVLGHLFLNAQSNANTYINFDSGSNVVVNYPGDGWVAIGTNAGSARLTVAGDVRATEVVYAESFVGDGSGLTMLDGRQITAGTVSNVQLASGAVTSGNIAAGAVEAAHVNAATFSNTFWKVNGNAGTSTGTHYVGTSDNKPLDLRVNNVRALRLEPHATSPNVVGGYVDNTVVTGVYGAAISGGGRNGSLNRVTDAYGVIGGGRSNTAGDEDSDVTDAAGAAVGGGVENTASGLYGTVPGGYQNVAGGDYSFAVGRRAKATNTGTFVWADSAGGDFGSTRSNQFVVRAAGGVGIGTAVTPEALTVAGNVSASNFIGSGSGLTGLDGGEIQAGSVGTDQLADESVTGDKIEDYTITGDDVASNTFWSTRGNANTVAGTHFIGTTDFRPLQFRVRDEQAVKITPYMIGPTVFTPSVAVGSRSNEAAAAGAVVSGGGTVDDPNYAAGEYSVVAGGMGNRLEAFSDHSAIGGGQGNTIDNASSNAVIGGGMDNELADASFSVIGGGSRHGMTNIVWGTIGGGLNNAIGAGATAATIAGGQGNILEGGTDVSAIGGGRENRIGAYSEETVIGGGRENRMYEQSDRSVIGGGYANRLGPTSVYCVVAGGAGNAISNASFAVVGGGRSNRVERDADLVFLGGGTENSIVGTSTNSVLAGGRNNQISNNCYDSVLVGGVGNQLRSSAFASVVVGGSHNVNDGGRSFVGGGSRNWNAATDAVIVGGSNNYNSGRISFVGGGINNSNSNPYAVIVGGADNKCYEFYGFIGGGQNNELDGGAAAIVGGAENYASGTYAFLGGGYKNSITNIVNYGTIAGGYRNVIDGSCDGSFIGGGTDNAIDGAFTGMIGGGQYNTIHGGDDGVIAGGRSNTNWNSTCGFIGGGRENRAEGDYAMIVGGRTNLAGGVCSFAAGNVAHADHDGAFVWSDVSSGTPFHSTTNDEVAIRAVNGVRIAENAGDTKVVEIGRRYRDNSIIAWARVLSDGSLGESFGIQSASRLSTGEYQLVLMDDTVNSSALVPVAIAEIDGAPSSAAAVRIVSINQVGTTNFNVYINSGTFALVDNDFTFMVTGR